MKPFLILTFALLATLVRAEDLPWIGVSFKSPSSEDREAASLKPGVGFRADGVVANGPLAKAGGKNNDLWWKFDGQILVNMGQMVVLLREKKVGDTVKVEFFREGKLQELNVVLGSRHRPQVMPVSMVNEDEETQKSRRLAKREQVARLTMDERALSLEAEGDQWRFKVTDGDVMVLSALVADDGFGETLPRKWYGAFIILKQTLLRSQKTDGKSSEKRVRFVPREVAKSSTE